MNYNNSNNDNNDDLTLSNFEDNEIINFSNIIFKFIKISFIDGNYNNSDKMIFNLSNLEYKNIVLSNRLIKNKIILENIDIIDKINNSVWNKFMYKTCNNNLFKLKWVICKDIQNTILLLKISLCPIILNIDEHCILFLLTICDNIKNIISKNNNDSNSDKLVIKETIIDEILFTLSYKISANNNYNKYGILNLTKIRDINFFLNKIYFDNIFESDLLIKEIYNTWVNDLKENQYYKFLFIIDIFKYIFLITSDLILSFNEFNSNDGSVINRFKNLISTIGVSVTSNFLNVSTRSCIGTYNILEKFNNKSTKNKYSIYKNSPQNLYDGLQKNYNTIIERYNIIRNSEYNVSYRCIQPLLGITETLFNSLMGLNHTINPDDYNKKRERYN